MSDSNKSVLTCANAAIAAGDTEGFLAHCTDDAEWTFVGERTIRGKAAIRQYLAETYAKPPRFDVSELVGDGDVVVALGQITVTGADGAETASWYCDVWTLRDGKLDRLRAFVVEQR